MCCDRILHKKGLVPMEIYNKMAFFNSMVHRLLSLPLSTEDHKNEVEIIKHIAIANGYKCNIIDKIINKKQNRLINIDMPK